jgi:hypothetical protein
MCSGYHTFQSARLFRVNHHKPVNTAQVMRVFAGFARGGNAHM